jgi:subtilase family serine protease
MTMENEIKVSISVSLKVNLGNYESADAFVSLSNVPVGASAEEIDEALSTGKLAWGLIKGRVMAQAEELRAGKRVSA